MARCKNCKAELPLLPSKRSFVERYITQRNTKKFKCHNCNELQFLSPFTMNSDVAK